ncbi:flagellin [Methylobacterium sp. Leaf111]|uniref:flagellin N-terminal helical domain-containing protein n=1 Tax=Methylobacterium sp. Leaf111 TaxID=1736257 RepID=UPI0006FDCEAE|nr:flagellin [Methylobacterium sp. Leaf111]KQP67673.1 flagellin [Methylobacterium sp. Leaf111]
MSSYDVTLSAATRSNLLSLQNTASLTATNQGRLSTGKKVNSALDNPTNFFTASALNNRSTALNGLLDGISNGIQTIQAASKGIDSVTSLVKQLQSTVKQAQTNAATNLPKITSSVSLATTAEAALTGKSQRDTVLAKSLFGAVGTATASSAGNLGFTDATDAGPPAVSNSIRIKAGSSTYDVKLSANATVNDLVNGINKSGVATADLDSSGKLVVTGTGSDPVTVAAGNVDDTGVFAATTAQDTALFGTADTTDVVGGGTSAARSSLISQFNDVRTQLDQLAKDAGFNGTNLLGGDKLSIVFNEKTGASQNKLDVQGSTISSSSLGIGQFVDSATASVNSDFSVQNNSDLTKAADALTNALTTLSSFASTLGSNLATVQTRQDFTKQISDVLNTGASNLTSADLNEEAANSNALSTRQSLGISALSLANQANQGILQLLR